MKKLSKLKLEKIKLNELSDNELSNIQGGYEQVAPSITVIGTVIVFSAGASCVHCSPTVQSCLTCKPGHQDSCGLCTTNYAC